MTYIKWKDEVESYLVSLPQEEKQKIFSYFSEMYADKRDAGKSEEQIIEEFGAPYDVAKKILSDSRDAAAQNSQPDGSANVSGGNNYNYNYYNYNYGGAPAQSPPPGYGYTPPKQTEAEPQPDVFGEGLKMPKKSKPKKKTSVWRVLFGILFVFILAVFTVSLIGSALGIVLDGFVSIGYTVGALAASECGGAEGATSIGLSLAVSGVGCILLAPFGALCGFLWRKLVAFLKGA